jgi:predicted flavoprotein YhiN
MTHIYDVIIVGSGPGGLMAAVAAEKRKLSYLVIDKNAIAGKKLLITGASRCNVTNPFDVRIFIEKLSLKHKRFLYSTLSSFGTNEVKQFIETNGVELVLENDLKYFPKSSKSIDILNVFLRNINLNNIRYNQKVIKIQKQNDFIVTTDKNE